MRLAREDPDRPREDWGYSRMPSRECPVNDLFIEWIYVIDLDLDVFRVSDTNINNPDEPGMNRYFRIDNIPRDFFLRETVETTGWRYPVMSDLVPDEHFADHLGAIPEPEPTLLALYQSFSPRPVFSFSIPSGDRNSPWDRLQLELLGEFVQYFIYSFSDSWPSRTSSPFVFRQLAYAVLSLASSDGMKFHYTTAKHALHANDLDAELCTPSWDPPDDDTYWLGDVLIVLNQHLSTTANGSPSPTTQASIAHAVQLAGAKPTIAVIFSVRWILLVHIAPGEPITHSVALPLLALDPTAEPFSEESLAGLETGGYATPGFLALIDLFRMYPHVPRFRALSSAIFPAELCRMVFRYADEDTQTALEETCRMFRAIAAEYPRIGGRTLAKWGPEDSLEFGGPQNYGWEVGVWGRDKLRLNMPVVRLE